ncbi:CopD family protein [Neokomagataea anthophila]|uniref:CopD family protein n=1 Tax=Neokomagataea anthophila TaxID=2826925 RepID=A0ABS5E5V7_9PROT|nr:CopD family protein [Neokomagataea anthophila]MBR0559294.1 CopD family protein [Neokomagataea anthophila]
MDYFIRFGLYTALTMCFGGSFFLSTYFDDVKDSKHFLSIKYIFSFFCAAALIFSVLQIVMLTVTMEDIALSDISLEAIFFLLQQGGYDVLFTLRFVALGAVLFLSLRKPSSKANWFAGACLSGISLITMVWLGHAASYEVSIGWMLLVVDAIHILTAAAWGGSLFAFCWLIFGNKEAVVSERILKKFSIIGYVIVVLMLLTGAANTYFMVGGDIADYLHPDFYVILIYMKLIAFSMMLLFASLNHFVLTPRLGRGLDDGRATEVAVRRLRISVLSEYVFYLVIMALVAVVGVQSPTPDM